VGPVEITDLSKEELIRMVGVFFGNVVVHHGMWLTETAQSLGIEKAVALEHEVMRSYALVAAQMLAPHFNIEMQGVVPQALAEKSREELILLVGDVARTWALGDSLWLQAVERAAGMAPANKVNDSCWAYFAHAEAFKIRTFLELGDRGGLQALEKALKLRIYSSINAHASEWQDDGSLLFKMTECRIQTARRVEGMAYYPCKSSGIEEYSNFASSIDSRIRTECSYCPPDRIPDEQFCAWRFTLEKE